MAESVFTTNELIDVAISRLETLKNVGLREKQERRISKMNSLLRILKLLENELGLVTSITVNDSQPMDDSWIQK